MTGVLGVDGCRGGWVGALVDGERRHLAPVRRHRRGARAAGGRDRRRHAGRPAAPSGGASATCCAKAALGRAHSAGVPGPAPRGARRRDVRRGGPPAPRADRRARHVRADLAPGPEDPRGRRGGRRPAGWSRCTPSSASPSWPAPGRWCRRRPRPAGRRGWRCCAAGCRAWTTVPYGDDGLDALAAAWSARAMAGRPGPDAARAPAARRAGPADADRDLTRRRPAAVVRPSTAPRSRARRCSGASSSAARGAGRSGD